MFSLSEDQTPDPRSRGLAAVNLLSETSQCARYETLVPLKYSCEQRGVFVVEQKRKPWVIKICYK